MKEIKKKNFSLAKEDKRKNFISFINDNKELIGFINLLDEGSSVFFGIGMKPNYCGMGIGKEIMEFMIDEYKETCSTVQLACIKENLKGLCFWEKLGFKEIDVKRCGNLEVRVLEKGI